MAPVEWPIAAPSADDGQVAARCAARDRLASVRADLFLDPDLRLTEQERSLMTAMVVDLVSVVADEVRAAAGINDNGDSTELFAKLRSAGLLDLPGLVVVLLQRAEEQRFAAAARSGGSAGRGRFVQSLAGDQDPAIASAAMALVLGRSRRRDRYGGPRIQLDDVPAEAAVRFVYSVAAAIGSSGAGDRAASNGAAAVLSHHDESKRLEALNFALVHALENAGRLDEAALSAAAADGEVALLVEALARDAGVDFNDAWTLIQRSDFPLLLRLAGVSRQFAAELIASFSQVLRGGASEAIERFDGIGEQDVDGTREQLRLDLNYRAAAAALGGRDGDRSV